MKDKKLISEIQKLANDIIDCIDHVTTVEQPSGSGYFAICKQVYEEDNILLQVAIECCLYEDETDHHQYYGLYSVAEIADGEDISESNWSYTDKPDAEQLANLIADLYDTFTREYLLELYQKSLTD